MTRRLVAYFFRGLVLLAPLAVTVYVSVVLFQAIDGWLGLSIPGVGFVATLLFITLVGLLGRTCSRAAPYPSSTPCSRSCPS